MLGQSRVRFQNPVAREKSAAFTFGLWMTS
jgi:hypothetical protein